MDGYRGTPKAQLTDTELSGDDEVLTAADIPNKPASYIPPPPPPSSQSTATTTPVQRPVTVSQVKLSRDASRTDAMETSAANDVCDFTAGPSADTRMQEENESSVAELPTSSRDKPVRPSIEVTRYVAIGDSTHSNHTCLSGADCCQLLLYNMCL